MHIKQLLTHSYIKFFITGASGVILNLIITGVLAHFVFSDSYFIIASIIGTACNLVYNFILHTKLTFKTKSKHKRRFGVFITYSLILASFQELLVAKLTILAGTTYLLIIKAIIIFSFSLLTYLVFRFILFKEK